MPSNFHRILPLFILLLVCGLTGCSGPSAKEKAELQYFLKANERDGKVSTDHFVVAPPDGITIHATAGQETIKDVDGLQQQIAPDGTINLGDPIRRVYIAGLTPREVENVLEDKLNSTKYKDAIVNIDVAYRSQFYYVIGEVNAPGAKTFTGRDTLVQVLANANVTRLGWPERIYVIHSSADPAKRHYTVINMYDILHRGDTSANVLLQQDDIVYVPLNPLAAVGVAVQNLLFPVQPVISMTTTGASIGKGGL